MGEGGGRPGRESRNDSSILGFYALGLHQELAGVEYVPKSVSPSMFSVFSSASSVVQIVKQWVKN